jgi:hypothetical protein
MRLLEPRRVARSSSNFSPEHTSRVGAVHGWRCMRSGQLGREDAQQLTVRAAWDLLMPHPRRHPTGAGLHPAKLASRHDALFETLLNAAAVGGCNNPGCSTRTFPSERGALVRHADQEPHPIEHVSTRIARSI